MKNLKDTLSEMASFQKFLKDWKNFKKICRENKGMQILAEATKHLREDRGWVMASHLAMSALISIFPFLICATSLIGMMKIEVDLDQLTNVLLQTWPKDAAKPIANEIHSILTVPRTSWLTFGSIVALWIASSGIEALRTAMNEAYGVRVDSRGFLFKRLQSFFLVLIGCIGFIAFSILIVLAPLIWDNALNWFPILAEFEHIFDIGRILTTIVLLAICLIICHTLLPNNKELKLRDTIPGVVTTLVLWITIGYGFGKYLENFSNYASTYAGLAGIMSAFVFLYLISLLFIFGGELNGAILRLRNSVENNGEAK